MSFWRKPLSPAALLALSLLELGLRMYLGIVFVMAAAGKIADPAGFALSIASYQSPFVPNEAVNLMAIMLPWVELLAGLGLIIGFRVRAQALLVCGMLVVFMIAIHMALDLGLKLQCGCFASKDIGHELSVATLLRDLGWFVIGVLVLLAPRHRFSLDRLLERRR